MLKAVVENLDDVEEGLRQFYEEKSGKFYLKVEGVNALPAVAAMKTAMDRKETERNAAKQELAALKEKIGGDLPEDWSVDEWLRLKGLEDDIDPTDPKAREKKKAKDDERLATLKQNYESQIANLKAKAKEDNDTKDAIIADLNKARANDKAEVELEKAMDKANIDPRFRPAVRALHKDTIASEIEEGDDKNIRLFVKTDLGEASVSDYIASWSQTDDGKIYVSQASGPSPNGVRQPNQPGGINPFLKAHWNKSQQAALRNDAAKLDRLAKAAGFKTGTDALAATHAIQ